MTKKHVVEPQPQQLLRSQQRHTRLLRRAIALTLITLDAGRYKVMRRAFSTLCSRQDVIERQVLGMLVFTAILAAIAVADVDASALHRRLAALALDMNVMTQPDDRWNGKLRRRRMKDIVAVILLDENGPSKP